MARLKYLQRVKLDQPQTFIHKDDARVKRRKILKGFQVLGKNHFNLRILHPAKITLQGKT